MNTGECEHLLPRLSSQELTEHPRDHDDRGQRLGDRGAPRYESHGFEGYGKDHRIEANGRTGEHREPQQQRRQPQGHLQSAVADPQAEARRHE